ASLTNILPQAPVRCHPASAHISDSPISGCFLPGKSSPNGPRQATVRQPSPLADCEGHTKPCSPIKTRHNALLDNYLQTVTADEIHSLPSCPPPSRYRSPATKLHRLDKVVPSYGKSSFSRKADRNRV